MLLLNKKPYHKITVSDIAKKAGIARQKFYRNYNKKNDIIEQFLSQSVSLQWSPPESGENGLVLTFDLGYITSHRDDLMKIILNVNIHDLFPFRFREWINDLIDRYSNKLSDEEYLAYRYHVYYQIIGSVYIFGDWFKNDMPLSSEKLSAFLNSFTLPDSLRRKQVPHISIRLQNG
jgi:AcrR family transcriptional regulator